MTRIGWRPALGAALTLIVAAAVAVGVLALGGSSSAPSTPRARAEREAARLIAAVRLPAALATGAPGASAQSAVAGIDHPSAPDTAQRSAQWSVPESAARVRSFLAAHPPAGTRRARAGALSFAPTGHPPGLMAEGLALSVVPAGPRASTVRALAAVGWVVARARSERVPAGPHELVITRGALGSRPSLLATVTSRELIRRVVTLLDDLPPVQPSGVYRCTTPAPEIPVITFTFRGGAGRVLAVASEQADVPARASVCEAVRFTVGGRVRMPLLGGHRLLREVSALLGRRLWAAPYAA